ncbi:hypothetical protein, partial [Solicola sp. PLA-1-18]|uniref:hypothetical protein n=1 Tax=Solicola sp. PLA-1-18 TaxID=3380532 RepID=UPI003B7B5AE2
MACDAFSPIACAGEVVKGGVKSAAGSAGESAMEGVANFFNEAAEWAVKNLTAAWLNAPSPDVQSSASTTSWLSERLTFFVLAAMVGAFFVAAYKLATSPRAEHVRDLGETLVRVILTTTIAATLITTAVEVGDLFADWIIAQADVDLGNSVLTKIPNPGLLLVLALVMAVAQLIQLVLMIVRNAMIVYLAAVLPLAAASSSTAAGKQWWSKSIAWLIAFVL